MKPSDIPFVTLLLQSWWTLLLISSFLVIVSGAIGFIFGRFNHDDQNTAEVVELINSILATWYDFAIQNGIDSVPVGVEFNNVNAMFLGPEQAVVVVRKGTRDQYYRVVKEQYSDLRVRHEAYTFKLDDTPRPEEE